MENIQGKNIIVWKNYQTQCACVEDEISNIKMLMNKKITDQEKRVYKNQIKELREKKVQIMKQYENQSRAEINES